ncbi:MAG: hypothetical protein E4H40_08750 [Candidatus Brocadiia bacterium]|nr:MAG: hypothetical protein E4H40_08750 [Candidatus Brocadiia bacterium]
MDSIDAGRAGIPITELDIAGGVIDLLDHDDLTEARLLRYFESNASLLKQNISQAKAKYQEDTIGGIVKLNFPRYIQNSALILSNHKRFAAVKDHVIEKLSKTYGNNLPAVVLVPCLGLFSAGGWADPINGTHHIFIALERLPEDFQMEILLAHEITHAISEIDRDTVLGGFYNEGYATYVSSVLYPGHNEETYFFSLEKIKYDSYLDWIDKHRDKIYQDSGEPFVVLDEIHKLYFTSSFSDYPNIGYVIGFKYLEYLNRGYTLQELRTLGMNESENRKAFKAFICNSEF